MAEIPGAALLVIISAPSGGGKTTLCQKVVETNPNAVRAVTCTTRPRREGEQNGIDYHFLEASAFLKQVEAGDFLEHAKVHDNYYGTLKSEVFGKLQQGKDVLLSIDVQGSATIRAEAARDPVLRRALVTVFITPPSISILEERLKKRGTDTPEVIAKRLSVARQEIAEWKHYDYVIMSGSIANDVNRMLAILNAEKLRQVRVQAPILD